MKDMKTWQEYVVQATNEMDVARLDYQRSKPSWKWHHERATLYFKLAELLQRDDHLFESLHARTKGSY